MKFLILLLFLLFGPLSYPQISSEIRQQIDTLFTQWDRNDSPGCAVAITSGGKIVFKKGYGMADLENGIPIRPNTVFYSGSISKQFVAACILLLAEEGKLKIHDSLSMYFPGFKSYANDILLTHLIHHTSGLKDYFELLEEAGRNYLDQIPKSEVLELIQKQDTLAFAPGSEFSYSNSGYILLAEIIRMVSGSSLPDFARERIFAPLGMHNSRFLDDNRLLIYNRAHGYNLNEKGEPENMIMRFDLVGSGGLYTTVEDLYLWDMQYEHPVIGSESFNARRLQTAKLDDGADTQYAFAIRIGEHDGNLTQSHAGSLGGYRAFYIRVPGKRLSVIILSNLAAFDPEKKAVDIVNILLKSN